MCCRGARGRQVRPTPGETHAHDTPWERSHGREPGIRWQMWVNFAIAPWSVFGALLPSRSLEGENLHTEQPTKSELKKVFHKRSLVNRQVYPNASQVTAVRVAN